MLTLKILKPVYIIIYIFTFLFFISCSNQDSTSPDAAKFKENISEIKTSQNPEKSDADYKHKEIQDSTIKAERMKQAKIAYGDIEFGISKDSYSRLAERNNIEVKYTNTTHIGNNSYTVIPYFNSDDKLYAINFSSRNYTANYYDNELIEVLSDFESVIKNKYGEPDFYYGIPELAIHQPRAIRWVEKWNIETKKICLGIGEDSEGYKYFVYCSIYDDLLSSEKLKQEEDAKNKTRLESSNKF
jgi:hypothetical protein